MHCTHCGEPIALQDNHRLPPWCRRCGADLRPGAAPNQPSASASTGMSTPSSSPGTDEAMRAPPGPHEEDACPACGIGLDLSEAEEDCVLSCPECGQCLRVPRSWPAAQPGAAARPAGWAAALHPARGKLPGWWGVGMGLAFAGPLWLFPAVSLFARLALTTLGSGLLAEGVGRLRADARRRRARRRPDVLAVPERMAEGVSALGSLRAVFWTGAERGTNALAVAFVALAFACAEGYLIELLRDGLVSPKLFLAALVAPLAAAYTFYRAGRCYFDQWEVLVFADGLVCMHGRRIEVHFRDTLAGITQVELDDAIDERAVVIRLTSGKPPLRFTCSHFHNLDHFGDRVRREFFRPAILETASDPTAGNTRLAGRYPEKNHVR